MKFLLLIPILLISCKDEKANQTDLDSKKTSSAPSSNNSSSPTSTAESSQDRQITPRSKRIPTGTWHPEKEGFVISPHNDEAFLATGVISGSKVTDSEGNNFLIPAFGKSPGPKYPTGIPIPDRPGFIFNPWTDKEVDVRGIPPGSLVRDPDDPDVDHKFRVPPKQ